MGLLDEAIREHLELKRRRGADPTAVAREEQEALAPSFPAEHGDPDGDDGYREHEPQGVHDEEAPAQVGPVDDAADAHAELGDLSGAGQETAELDMQAVLEEDVGAVDGAAPLGPIADSAARAANIDEMPAENSVEWEAPGEREGESSAEDVPGQERLSFD